MNQTFKKFDIITLQSNPHRCNEAEARTGIVIQSDLFNEHSNTLIIVPLTPLTKNIFPSQFFIHPSSKNGLKSPHRFLGDQIITIDQRFVIKKSGRLESKYHDQLHEALSIVLDIENDF